MIHPHTVVRTVSPAIGNGVFATARIPMGTIVVVRDGYDLVMTNDDFYALPDLLRRQMETYMYRDKNGSLVLGWDHARYMNHNCNSNTLMTDYNLEIAVRDIAPGEEVTTDYGLLNVIEPYRVECGCENCRGHLQLDDIDHFADKWDNMIQMSLRRSTAVEQPLLAVMPATARHSLVDFLDGKCAYSSVRSLKWRPDTGDRPSWQYSKSKISAKPTVR